MSSDSGEESSNAVETQLGERGQLMFQRKQGEPTCVGGRLPGKKDFNRTTPHTHLAVWIWWEQRDLFSKTH